MHDDLGDAISEGRVSVDLLGLYYQDPTERHDYISPEEWEEIREWEKKPVEGEFLDDIPW